MLFRYWNVLKSGWKARRKNASILEFASFLGEWRDISMLRLLQAFLESAPQLVLQLYILLQRPRFEWKVDLLIAVTAACSLVSLVWAILAYSKSLRDFRTQGYVLSPTGLFFQLLWRVSTVASRVVAMVLFASYFKQWLFVAVGAHWIIMTMWLVCQRTRFCTDEDGNEHPYREKLFSAAVGFMYIFCFFNTREGMTRKRIVLFYSIMLVENSLFVSMWFPHRNFRGAMAVAALGVVWGGLVFGVVCMVLYYRFYHPSLPVQGIFLQKRTFDLEGQVTHTWVCCCCCRIRRSTERNTALDPDAAEGLIRNVNSSVNHHPAREGDLRSPPHSRDKFVQESSYVTGNLRQVVSGPDSSQILIHSTPARPLGMCSSHANHPLVTSRVPKILVTGATPEVTSPRDSVSNSSLVTLKEIDMETLDNLVQRPYHPVTSTTEDIERTDVNADKKNRNARRELGFQNDITYNSPKSPTAGEIISWFHPEPACETSSDAEEDKTEKINYGSLSFGNRYSLVSSDCISLSSESSRSSIDSIVFADEGPGSSGVYMKKTLSAELTPRAADEGIFSDERDSPAKANANEDADLCSEASMPQKPRVNAQFPVLAADNKADTFNGVESREKTNEWNVFSNKPNEDSYNLVELLMDAPSSPSSSLKRKTREAENSLASEQRASGENRLSCAGEGSVSEQLDGHESESTDASSEGRNRHRSCDEIETGTSGALSSPDEINKRHTFDFSQLSKNPRSPRRKRERKHRRTKRKEFDNFVVTTLRPGKYGSLRRSIERLAKIQEDIEETFLLNTEAALNACIPEGDALSSPSEDVRNLYTKSENDTNTEQGVCSPHDSNQRWCDPQENGLLSARESFIKRKRMKRLLSKELVPGKFSSVRLSCESTPSEEYFQVFHENDCTDEDHMLSSTVSADRLPSGRHFSSKSQRINGGNRRKEFRNNTVSLPDVLRSTGSKFKPEVDNKPNPEKSQVKYPPENPENSTRHKGFVPNKRHTYDFNSTRHKGFVPNKRHTYDFTNNSASQIEMKERLLSTEDGKSLPEIRHHSQRRCQSEVLIGTRSSSVYV